MRIENNINKIVGIINSGEIICTPTDTLFALSCDATDPTAREKLYNLKQRNRDKKLPIFFRDLDHVKQHCHIPEIGLHLAHNFWPGKLTMILKLRDDSDIAMNAFDVATLSVAVRVPGDESILSVITFLDKPIIGTSANISGEKNISSYKEIEEQFRNCNITIFKPLNYISKSAIQSTIISFENDRPIILREGAISEQEIMISISFFEANLLK